MKCEDLNKLVILALVLGLLSSAIALTAGILNQRCDKEAKKERDKKDKKIDDEINELRKEISTLKKQLQTH